MLLYKINIGSHNREENINSFSTNWYSYIVITHDLAAYKARADAYEVCCMEVEWLKHSTVEGLSPISATISFIYSWSIL